MKILSIDTSTAVMGVALLTENKIIAETTTNLKTNHSVRLMPTIDQLFSEVQWSPEQIEMIAVAKGPGSYTGVRIGVTTAKTLAWSLNIPIVGVSTLEAMAYNNHHYPGSIAPIIDARRGQVYTGLYTRLEGSWTMLESDRIILLADWLKQLIHSNDQILFVGDDVYQHSGMIVNELLDQADFADSTFNFPRPSVIGTIALSKLRKGEIDNHYDFNPAYLQLAEAEVKWLEKNSNCLKE